MFNTGKLTVRTFKDISKILKLINFIRSFRVSCITQVVYILYLVYMLVTPNVIWYIHFALLLISISFFIYDIISYNRIKRLEKNKPSFWKIIKRYKHNKIISDAKKSKKKIERINFYISHILKFIILVTSFCQILISQIPVHPISIILTTLLFVFWLIRILIDVIANRLEMFKDALRADIESITKPVTNTIKNTVKRIMSEEGEEKSENTEGHGDNIADWLDARISKFRRKVGTKTDVYVENDDNNDF